jgi:hypothetical protein
MVFAFVGNPANGLTPDAERLSVYVLAAIVGLLVCGVISIAKELREEAANRS